MSGGETHQTERTSERLMRLARPHADERITIEDIVLILRERGFGLLMVVLALPMAIPSPPGLSTVFGIPLAILSLQLMAGWTHPLLPRRLLRLSVRHAQLVAFLHKARPHVERVERRLKPRYLPLTRRRALHVVGANGFLQAFLLILPIPMGNPPAAWSIVLMALGVLERDGAFVAAGLIVGVFATAWNVLVVMIGEQAITGLGSYFGLW